MAAELCHQAGKLLNHQRDQLSPEAIKKIREAIANLRTAMRSGYNRKTLDDQIRRLEETGSRKLIPYRSPGMRENVEVALFAVAIAMMFAASRILSARRRSALKLTSYECGIPSTPYRWSNINVRFYIFAILFLIFDVEAVFLFPWAVIFMQEKINQSNVLPFYAMMIFLGVLSFAIVYAWKKGVLEWQK